MPLRLEPLEERLAPAGGINTVLSRGSLTITGDDLANDFTITNGAADGELIITSGADATLIDGLDGPVTITGFTGSLTLALGAGSDSVAMSGLTVAGNVKVTGGEGDNSLTVGGATEIAGTFSVKNGAGNDDVVLDDVVVVQGASIDNGGGVNATALSASFRSSLTIKGGSSIDAVQLTSGSVGGVATIQTGDGESTVTVSNMTLAGLKILNKTGPVTFTLSDSTSSKGLALTSTSGATDVTIETATVIGTTSIKSGAGPDGMTISSSNFEGSVSITTGPGGSLIEIQDGCVFGVDSVKGKLFDLRIKNGAGDDYIDIDDMTVGKSFALDGGAGMLDAYIWSSQIGKDLSVKGGAASDWVDLFDLAVGGKATIDTAADDDVIIFDGIEITGALSIKTGGGFDEVYLDSGDDPDGPTSIFGGIVSVNLGADEDFLGVGSFGEAGNAGTYAMAVTFDGGTGYDEVDMTENGNVFAIAPVLKGIEEAL